MPERDGTTLSEPEAGRLRTRPTIRDVAALAGVSIKTVSRVVNGEPGVSSDLARRVELAAERLDFHPNLSASNLRRTGQRTATVGLLLEDVGNPFSSSLQRAIGDAAVERGVAVLATSLDENPVREREMVRAMVLRRVDGLVIMPSGSDHGYLRAEINAGLALVFVDRAPGFLDADTVISTNRDGARSGVEHLVGVGHRRIAFLGDLADIATERERQAGYLEAIRAGGLVIHERLVRTGLRTSAMAQEAVMELLNQPPQIAPTAIFASQNLVTVGAVRALRRLGLQHRVALVGLDDIELSDELEPAITVVAQDPHRMGREAAELLFARLDGSRGPSQHRLVPTRLIVRGSGEIAPPDAA